MYSVTTLSSLPISIALPIGIRLNSRRILSIMSSNFDSLINNHSVSLICNLSLSRRETEVNGLTLIFIYEVTKEAEALKQKGFSVDVKGLDDVLRMLEKQLGQQAVDDIDKITEAYARKMAAESAEMAPVAAVRGGRLRNSIAGSAQPSDELHVWEYGSDLPYATRQEYEHKTNKGFMRKSVWNNREKYRAAIKKRITRG